MRPAYNENQLLSPWLLLLFEDNRQPRHKRSNLTDSGITQISALTKGILLTKITKKLPYFGRRAGSAC
ncbi:MAG: hypothetical protein CSA33_06555 [Desulfobulbus propionicus]|nr:MAG: hypothetical protein CSA33_06555 [Desulfobulbus propionicus]